MWRDFKLRLLEIVLEFSSKLYVSQRLECLDDFQEERVQIPLRKNFKFSKKSYFVKMGWEQ